ncbi:MAG: 16S rRNA (guanine(966)-N(2))-methyltransferase RsmD [Candidatus Sedimenticola sp. (ex Thyasira tokunagai)]
MARKRKAANNSSRGVAGQGRSGQRNHVRIIGGEHRGRRLSFPDQQGLRPTTDRIRETLFNWLQPCFPGAVCLDLFAGSGVLGVEAASRGASRVTMVEKSGEVTKVLRENLELLRIDSVELVQGDAIDWLENPGQSYEVVFLDPPFADDLLTGACRLLNENGWLKPGARIYLERDIHGSEPQLPENWVELKKKQAGQVAYGLYTNQ